MSNRPAENRPITDCNQALPGEAAFARVLGRPSARFNCACADFSIADEAHGIPDRIWDVRFN
eukprot:7274043-Pyramimonas_sp.AAC.1